MKIYNSPLFTFFYAFEKNDPNNYFGSACVYLHLNPKHERKEANAYFEALGLVPDRGLEDQTFYRFSARKQIEKLKEHADDKNWFKAKHIKKQEVDAEDSLLEHKKAMLEAVSKGNVILVQMLLGTVTDRKVLNIAQEELYQIKRQQVAFEIEYIMYLNLYNKYSGESDVVNKKTVIKKSVEQCLSDAREIVFSKYSSEFSTNKEAVLNILTTRRSCPSMGEELLEQKFRQLLDYCTFFLILGLGFKNHVEPTQRLMNINYVGISIEWCFGVDRWPTENFSTFIKKISDKCRDSYQDFLKLVEEKEKELKEIQRGLSLEFREMVAQVLHYPDFLPKTYQPYLNREEDFYNVLHNVKLSPDFLIDGKSPLYVAIQNNNLLTVKFLLDRGARIDFPVSDGKSAWEILNFDRKILQNIQEIPSDPVDLKSNLREEIAMLLKIYKQKLQRFKGVLENPIAEFLMQQFGKGNLEASKASLDAYQNILAKAELLQDDEKFLGDINSELAKDKTRELFLGSGLDGEISQKVSVCKEAISKKSYGHVFSQALKAGQSVGDAPTLNNG